MQTGECPNIFASKTTGGSEKCFVAAVLSLSGARRRLHFSRANHDYSGQHVEPPCFGESALLCTDSPSMRNVGLPRAIAEVPNLCLKVCDQTNDNVT